MDESLGFVLYFEPSFVDLIDLNPVHVPGQLRKPHEQTTAFRDKHASASRACIPRDAPILKAFITTALDQGWKVCKYRGDYTRACPTTSHCSR
jgi:hypothetical protein